jgi:glycosyltransferase involved in cell wall biosynthesis
MNTVETMSTVHFVVPAGIDDVTRPSGGNVYDRRVIDGLIGTGWDVRVHGVTGPDARALSVIPDGALVVLDGLLNSDAVLAHAHRLRILALMHMVFADNPAERAVLLAAHAVIATSEWTRRRLLQLYPLDPDRIHVARPGADAAEIASGTPGGGELLCVAAVAPAKGQDLLLSALLAVANDEWRCHFVGPLDRDPAFVAQLRERAEVAGRWLFDGARTGADLDRCYAEADVLVLPSRLEAYGMVITEALARGLPVIATSVGGVPEALGDTRYGRPGLLVTPNDSAALTRALGSWLGDAQRRESLRAAARARRANLIGWETTVAEVATALGGEPGRAATRVYRGGTG